jgi:hypothetical protein
MKSIGGRAVVALALLAWLVVVPAVDAAPSTVVLSIEGMT